MLLDTDIDSLLAEAQLHASKIQKSDSNVVFSGTFSPDVIALDPDIRVTGTSSIAPSKSQRGASVNSLHAARQICSASSSAASSSQSGRTNQTNLYAQAETKLTSSIAMFCNSNALPFRTTECMFFRQMIASARYVSKDYKCPNRDQMCGPLLQMCYDVNRQSDNKELMRDAEIFGLSCQGDGATIRHCPLLNFLVSGVHLPVAVRKITDCQEWVAKGNKKDGTFIANEFTEVMTDLDPGKHLFDLCIMDGASVCKLSQELLKIEFPRLSCITGADHTGHNIFKHWAELPWIKMLIKQDKVCFLLFLRIPLIPRNF